ncbi:MAG: TolC family protein [Sandaracinaceae bacterium]
MSGLRIVAGALSAALVFSGCVSSRAGYGQVHDLTRDRLGFDDASYRTSRRHDDSAEERVHELLAAPLSAEAASRIALLNNPNVQASFESLGMARGALLQASVLPNPHASGEFRLPIDGNADDFVFEGEFLFDLAGAIRTPLRRGAAEADLRAETMRAAGEVMDLSYEARLAFIAYQEATQTQVMMQTVVEATRGAYDAAALLRAAGNNIPLDVAQQRAMYEEARLALAQSELAALDARERLQRVMGLHGAATEWQVPERLPDPPDEDPDLDSLEPRAVEASLELAELRGRMDANAQRVGVERNRAGLPEVRVGVAVAREEGVWSAGPSAEITLPLFDQNLGNIEIQEAGLRMLQRQHDARAITVRSAVRVARNRLVNARERVRFFQETLLPLREEVVQRTQLQYNAMSVGVFQLLTARRQQIETGRQYVATLGDYWRARAALQQILAGRLVDPDGMTMSAPPAMGGGDGGGH